MNDAERALFRLGCLLADLELAGVTGFRSPPPLPVTCCGRGCNGCVWESYYAAVGWWLEDAKLALDQARAVRP